VGKRVDTVDTASVSSRVSTFSVIIANLDGELQPRLTPLGSLVLVRYLDHVLFKDVDPSLCVPWTRETIGWLDYEDSNHLRLVWERFSMPDPPRESKPRATGLVILKKAIVELRRISA